mgnify:CR=1 FL=1
MALTDEVAAFRFVFDHQNFRRSANVHYFRFHFCAIDVRIADSRVFAVINQQNLSKGDFVTRFVFAGKFLNLDRIAHRNLILLAASLNNCKFFHSRSILHAFLLSARPKLFC